MNVHAALRDAMLCILQNTVYSILDCGCMQLCSENLEHSSSGKMLHVILFGSYPAGLTVPGQIRNLKHVRHELRIEEEEE